MDKFTVELCKNCNGQIVRFVDDPVKERWTHLRADVDDHNQTLRVMNTDNCPPMKAVPMLADKDV